MIVDANFYVYLVYTHGEKHSVHPTMMAADLQAKELEAKNASCVIQRALIQCTRDLENLLEENLCDEDFERWEYCSIKLHNHI